MSYKQQHTLFTNFLQLLIVWEQIALLEQGRSHGGNAEKRNHFALSYDLAKTSSDVGTN